MAEPATRQESSVAHDESARSHCLSDSDTEHSDDAQAEQAVPSAKQSGVFVGLRVYCESASELTIEGLTEILSHPDIGRVSTQQPSRPAGGSLFVFPTVMASSTRRCDQYRWLADGAKNIPRAEPILKKRYFIMKDERGDKIKDFRKHEYELLSKQDTGGYVVVHYLGDSSKAPANPPHRNSKKNNRPFIRTTSTVKQLITDAAVDADPIKVYRNLVRGIKCDGKSEATAKPRDHEQVRNFIKSRKRGCRISHDDLYNCLQLAYQFPEYVRFIQIYPNLVIHLGNDELFDEMLDSMKRSTQQDSSTVTELHYDTTFKLGNFYVSTLAFKLTLFESEPVIPIAFMVHERKYLKDHFRFMESIAERRPIFNKLRFVLATDSEFVFDSVFSNAKTVHCWNHIRRDIRFWFRNHRGGAVSATKNKRLEVKKN